MTIHEIIKIIEPIIKQSLDGQDIENIKIECKSKWWDLKSINGLSEFLKDVCAIANTFGLDGFVIIGYDDRKKSFNEAMFSDSGLNDNSEIRNILIKHVDMVFDLNTFDITIDHHKLSVLHIPPSIEKPHVLKVYKREEKNSVREEFNKIFIRKNSAIHVASKTDIDIMYYDRKNIIPDYKLLASIDRQSINIYGHGLGEVYIGMVIQPTITFENQGARPIAIVDIVLKFSEYTNPQPHEEYIFKLSKSQPIILDKNQIITCIQPFNATLDSPKSIAKATQLNINRVNLVISDITITTNIGNVMILPVLAY